MHEVRGAAWCMHVRGLAPISTCMHTCTHTCMRARTYMPPPWFSTVLHLPACDHVLPTWAHTTTPPPPPHHPLSTHTHTHTHTHTCLPPVRSLPRHWLTRQHAGAALCVRSLPCHCLMSHQAGAALGVCQQLGDGRPAVQTTTTRCTTQQSSMTRHAACEQTRNFPSVGRACVRACVCAYAHVCVRVCVDPVHFGSRPPRLLAKHTTLLPPVPPWHPPDPLSALRRKCSHQPAAQLQQAHSLHALAPTTRPHTCAAAAAAPLPPP